MLKHHGPCKAPNVIHTSSPTCTVLYTTNSTNGTVVSAREIEFGESTKKGQMRAGLGLAAGSGGASLDPRARHFVLGWCSRTRLPGHVLEDEDEDEERSSAMACTEYSTYAYCS